MAAAKAPAAAAGNTKLIAAAKILSEESGVEEEELTDDTIFADIGIDSLLSLVITSRFREELNMDMDTDDFFTKYATVKAFKNFFGGDSISAPAPAPAAKAAPMAKAIAAALPTPVVQAVVDSGAVTEALRIVSEESGVEEEELTDDTIFADVGIDSLLSLVITSRFREELNMDMDTDDFFTRYATVKELKLFFAPAGAVATVVTKTLKVKASAPAATVQAVSQTVVIATGFQEALNIISEESGVSPEDLSDDCIFADIGIDSLLSLVIVSRFREDLGMEIELDSVFTDFPTVGLLKSMFMPGSGETSETASLQNESSDEEFQDASSQSSVSEQQDGCMTPKMQAVPPATSVLLQGLPKNAKQTLFLFPDGAGSATSYSGIPRVGSDVAIVGLNSPYYRNPDEFKCELDDLIDSYINEIRRRQPSGPYHVGGWSAGGCLAYRATQKLIEAGESVDNLVLIDSPVPEGLDKLPQHFYDFCSEHRLFGHTTNAGTSAAPPEWLIPHFNATIDVLSDYVATPLPHGKAPNTSMIWAAETIVDGTNVPKMPPHPDDTEGMKFLTEKRTNFTGNGWERLFPGAEMRIAKATGANHFAMMVSSLELEPNHCFKY